MWKYLLRYLFFWLPALAVSYLAGMPAAAEGRLWMVFQGLQWFFAFFMVFGWSVNTGMAAYHLPRSAFSFLLIYTGAHLLCLSVVYTTHYRDPLHIALRMAGGLFSFQPLGIFLRAIEPFAPLLSVPWEAVCVLFLVACCFVGYLAGLLRRRIHPSPYRPRIMRPR